MKLFFKKASTLPLTLTLWASAKKKPATGAHAPARAIATGAAGEAGNLPSQSPNGASSPEGRAKSRLPLWGRCHAFGMTERASAGSQPSFRKATFLVRYRPGKTLRCFPSFFPALRACKGKTVGLCPTPCKLFEKSLSKNFTCLPLS